jgi:hypothetical protein
MTPFFRRILIEGDPRVGSSFWRILGYGILSSEAKEKDPPWFELENLVSSGFYLNSLNLQFSKEMKQRDSSYFLEAQWTHLTCTSNLFSSLFHRVLYAFSSIYRKPLDAQTPRMLWVFLYLSEGRVCRKNSTVFFRLTNNLYPFRLFFHQNRDPRDTLPLGLHFEK